MGEGKRGKKAGKEKRNRIFLITRKDIETDKLQLFIPASVRENLITRISAPLGA